MKLGKKYISLENKDIKVSKKHIKIATKIAATLLVMWLLSTNVYAMEIAVARVNEAKSIINAMANLVFEVIGILMYWIVLFCGSKEILESIQKANLRDIWGIILKYAAVSGTFYSLPKLFNFIGLVFGGTDYGF